MGNTPARTQTADEGRRETESAAADPIPVALDFLHACREDRRPLALVTGAQGTGKSMLMHRFARETKDSPVAHLKMPTESPHAFLENLLAEFGFDSFDSTVSDLFRLANVYLLHESGKDLRPVVIVEHVEKFGPAIWSLIRELSVPGPKEKPAALFVLTGNPDFSSELLLPAFDSVYSLDVTVRTAAVRAGPTIEVFLGDRPIGLHSLERPKIAIGRGGANDIRISGPFVSRFHAMLVKETDGVYIVDLQSTNGTCVNGTRVKRQRLESGDMIEIENFRLRYVDPVGAGQQSEQDDGDALVMQAPLDHLLDQSA